MSAQEITYAEMPLDTSPWVSAHTDQDVRDYIAYARNLGEKVQQLLGSNDSKTADSFLTGAQQALERYNRTTRAFQKTSKTSFRFADMKRETGKRLSVFVIADAAKIKAQREVISLIQWAALQELKRHPNTDVPVTVVADEGTNFKIDGLADLITWSRGYGVRLQMIIQDIAAFRRTYGKDALDTLLSETEVKLFLPGQRNPETIAILEKMIGSQAVMMRSQSGAPGVGNFWAGSWNLSEAGKPLLAGDQIREMDQGILFLRRNKPALVDVPPIAAMDDLREWIDINPFHGKPFLLPVSVWFKARPFSLSRMLRKLRRLLRNRSADSMQRKRSLERTAFVFRLLSSLAGLWWLALLIWLFGFTGHPYALFAALTTGGL